MSGIFENFSSRSTPCPHVKQSDEWIDPTVCEAGDNCKYCHTRTEQQFHPEVGLTTEKCVCRVLKSFHSIDLQIN